jgi:hypothetical protein
VGDAALGNFGKSASTEVSRRTVIRGVAAVGSAPFLAMGVKADEPSLAPNPEPALNGKINYGFNAKTWQFCDTQELLPMTFTAGRQIQLRHGNSDITYAVPDGVLMETHNANHGTNAMTFQGTHALDEQKFNSSVSASLSVEGVSASTSLDLAKSSSIDDDEKVTTTIISYWKTIYMVRRQQATSRSDAFVSAVADLFNREPRNFSDFFDTWGTHTLLEGYFGGLWKMKTVVRESHITQERAQDIKSAVEAGFDDGIDSGSVKTSIETSVKDKLTRDNISSEISFDATGGNSDDELKNWLISVDTGLELLFDFHAFLDTSITPKFAPIWNLAPDPDQQRAMKDAYKAYVGPSARLMDDLPDPIAVDVDHVLEADTDGFLSGALTLAKVGDLGLLQLGGILDDDHGSLFVSSDPESDPGTTRVALSVHRVDWCSNFFTPIRAKDRYRAARSFGGEDLTPAVQFQPINLELGSWTPIPLNTLMAMRQDGFVVAMVRTGHTVTGGVITGRQNIGSSTFEVGASAHWDIFGGRWIMSNSFCIPVTKATSFRVDPSLIGDARAQAFWIPIGSRYSLLAPEVRDINTTYDTADCGILVGSLKVSPGDDEKRAWLMLKAAAANDGSFSNASTAGASVGVSGDDSWIKVNSASVFVRAGGHYRGDATVLNGDASHSLMWFGLRQNDSSKATSER